MTPTLRDRLNSKLRLEQRLTNELGRFIRAYLNAWGEARDAGTMLPRTGWQNRLASLFAEHYARVIVAMDGAGDASLPLHMLRDGDVAQRFLTKAHEQAIRLMDRLERDLAAAETLARTQKTAAIDLILKASQRPKFSVVVMSTMRRVWDGLKRSLGGIANINTQDVAEEAAQVPVDIVPNEAGAETWYKQWVSMEDHKVRPTHVAAHGQLAKIEDTFTVGGFQMRFPGDSSLGAPLKELVNCRCAARYGVMRDGEFVPVGGLETVRGVARPVRRPGDKPGSAAPRVPTRAFTFATGNSRRRIILSTGEDANVTVRNGAITIRVDGAPVASAPLNRGPLGKFTLGPVTVSPSHRGVDFQRLLSASVEATNGLRQAP